MLAFFVETVRFRRIFRTSSHNVKLAENDGCFRYAVYLSGRKNKRTYNRIFDKVEFYK